MNIPPPQCGPDSVDLVKKESDPSLWVARKSELLPGGWKCTPLALVLIHYTIFSSADDSVSHPAAAPQW